MLWLEWAAARGISEVYVAPHAGRYVHEDPCCCHEFLKYILLFISTSSHGSNALIAIPGVEGSARVEALFCDFIWLAEGRGIGVQLLSTPATDAHFVRNCSSRHLSPDEVDAGAQLLKSGDRDVSF